MKAELRRIYGDDDQLLAAQAERYDRARAHFRAHFGLDPTSAFRTPGRINLIGEHTDYNGGFVLPVALDRDILCVVRPRQDPLVRAINVETQFAPFSFELSRDIPSAPHGDWSNYFRGAGQELNRHFGKGGQFRGMDACVSGAPPHGVPRGAGLSSSTALTVTAALALTCLNQAHITRPSLAHLCSEAEWYVGTRGGMMDQFSALLGQRDHALFLDCRPGPDGTYSYDQVPIPPGVEIVLLDSGVHHENVRSQFNQRVAECRVGVRLLQQHYPAVTQLRDVTPENLGLTESEFWNVLEERVPAQASREDLLEKGIEQAWLQDLIADHRLDPQTHFAVLPRCRHVITENERVLSGIRALRTGQTGRFGALMDQAHHSMSADYGASCPEADTLVEIVREQPGVSGARITGAGWGGSIVALAEGGSSAAWAGRVQDLYQAATRLECEIFLCRPADGAGAVELTNEDDPSPRARHLD
jgi:galactokinase